MQQIEKQLDDLIVACGSATPLDYMRFYFEVDELLTSGVGPHSCCLVLSARVKQLMTVIDEFSNANRGGGPSDVDDTTKHRLVIAFNGVKLLLGFVGYLPLEMRSFIADQTGVSM